ncbi:MAG TPA: flagellar biosynthesis anti-sigma factor FlgM [Syntrophobacter fumaroxidans]|nr:flagellar biosynthesis anti-sigma factor FlgM [Syntrophobacter fumaroxidans]
MGTRKNSDHPGRGTRLLEEKANGKARHGIRTASATDDATLVTAQVARIVEEIVSGEVRPERIRSIKSLIENDAYTIQPDEIARKMLGEIW